MRTRLPILSGIGTVALGLALLTNSGCPGGDNSPPGAPQSVPYLVQQAYLKASNTTLRTYFGYSISLSGDTLVVGAPGDDFSNTRGEVYVFTRTGITWSQQANLIASNANSKDGFGTSVALDGDTLVVGAPFEDSNATGVNGDQTNNTAADSGAVYVFTRTGTTWSQQAYLKASNTESGDLFGHNVALAGDTLAVGAGSEDSNAVGINGNQLDNSALGAGAVYVFTRTGNNWSQQAYLKASNTDMLDAFASRLALSADGNTLAVGALGEDSLSTGINGNQGNDTPQLGLFVAGAVYVFTRSNGIWAQEAYIKASNTDPTDRFGNAVTLSADGNTLAVGAVGEESNALGINGNQADNSGGNPGAVYVFTRSGGTWSQQAYMKAPNTDHSGTFGDGLALSADSNSLVVAAPDFVYVFTRTGTNWTQQASVTASNRDVSDPDGFGGSLSVFGNTVVMGAHAEDSNATGVNGDQMNNNAPNSGAVYVFVTQ